MRSAAIIPGAAGIPVREDGEVVGDGGVNRESGIGNRDVSATRHDKE